MKIAKCIKVEKKQSKAGNEMLVVTFVVYNNKNEFDQYVNMYFTATDWGREKLQDMMDQAEIRGLETKEEAEIPAFVESAMLRKFYYVKLHHADNGFTTLEIVEAVDTRDPALKEIEVNDYNRWMKRQQKGGDNK